MQLHRSATAALLKRPVLTRCTAALHWPTYLQVDFSQSVSHLWKQFKRFGRKGNADLAGQADTHQREAAGAM